MGIYDLISDIAQDKCEKLYKISFKTGTVSADNRTITIGDYLYDFADLFIAQKIYSYFDDEKSFVALCICNGSDIAVIDKLGGV